MKTPWISLPSSAPYILEEDRVLIEQFNKSASTEHCIHPEILPEPYLGQIEAPVVLLNLNPGFNEKDIDAHDIPYFNSSCRKCLFQEQQEYPFYLLDPENKSPGQDWWKRKLKSLLQKYPGKYIANKILCVEYFAYHSYKFGHGELMIPSQQYSFDLVVAALKRKAIIILMRGERYWVRKIPQLLQYERLFRLKSCQNVVISPNNCPAGFNEIINEFRI